MNIIVIVYGAGYIHNRQVPGRHIWNEGTKVFPNCEGYIKAVFPGL